MNKNDMILSEFIDGELDPDLHARVEALIAKDPVFRSRYDELAKVKHAMNPAEIDVEAASIRVWQKIQRDLPPRTEVGSFTKLVETFHRKILLPLPALAAVAVIAVGLIVFAVTRNNPASVGDLAALRSLNGSSIPASISASTASSPVSNPSPGTVVGNTQSASSGLEVTLELQNVNELLKLLQGNNGIEEFTVRLPQSKSIQRLGDPEVYLGQGAQP